MKTFKQNGLHIHIPFDMTDFKFRSRFTLNKYEPEEAKYLEKYLHPESIVLELGACLGYISCLTNKILNNKNSHVVLEANPKLIELIEKNRVQNECFFKIENAVISLKEKNIFNIHDLIVGGSTVRETPNQVEVHGLSIESLEDKYDLTFNTLIIDIEGGELEIFRNFKPSIKRFRQIFVEVHPFSGILTEQQAIECEDILCSLGFELIVRDGYFQVWEKDDN